MIGAGIAFIFDFIGGAAGGALEQAVGNGSVSLKDSIKDVQGKGGIAPATRPTHGQWFSDKGYNPKLGERTFDGHFKRFGTEPNQHGIEGPHVHQPTRNINPNNGIITGKSDSKTKNGSVTVPEAKDIKQLYEYLINGKYRKG